MSHLLHARRILCAVLAILGVVIAGNAPSASAAGTQQIDRTFTLGCFPSVTLQTLRIRATAPATTAPGQPITLTDVKVTFGLDLIDILPTVPPPPAESMQAFLLGLELESDGATASSIALQSTPKTFPPVPKSVRSTTSIEDGLTFASTTTSGGAPVVLSLKSFDFDASFFRTDTPSSAPTSATATRHCTGQPGASRLALIPSTDGVPPPPVITSVSPNFGPVDGGNTVTVKGDHLTDTDDVLFGSFGQATDVEVVDDHTVTLTAPSYYQEGPVEVQAIGRYTTAPASATARYFYGPAPRVNPVITAVTPNVVPAAGGASVTIRGTGLGDVTGVFLDGRFLSTSLIGSVDGTSLTVTLPTTATWGADLTGPHQLSVAIAGRCLVDGCASADTPAGIVTFGTPPVANVPAVSGVDGYAWGGVGGLLRVHGSKLTGAKYVTIGTKKVRPLLVIGSTDVLVLAPALPKGRYPVAVGTATAVSAPASRATVNYR